MFDKRKDSSSTPTIERKPSPEQPRQSAAPAKPVPSMIGRTVAIEGTLTAQEDILLEGRFNGEVVLMENALVVGQSGDIRADIKAKNVTIHGKANGDIKASDQVEISASGSMRGDILSPRVILHDGAKFKGRIDMEPEGIEKAAKRTSSAKGPAKSADTPASGPKSPVASDTPATNANPAESRARA
ncbi:MAG: polymer-forming cytoskeletal protein [Gammaproteobacteria bacterium]|nr:polymer-forming cytoskeletal protein [Gammaproteobacteria bacterium]